MAPNCKLIIFRDEWGVLYLWLSFADLTSSFADSISSPFVPDSSVDGGTDLSSVDLVFLLYFFLISLVVSRSKCL